LVNNKRQHLIRYELKGKLVFIELNEILFQIKGYYFTYFFFIELKIKISIVLRKKSAINIDILEAKTIITLIQSENDKIFNTIPSQRRQNKFIKTLSN
jgi:hypothetical protein